MATKQLIETALWRDKWFLSLKEKSKLLFIYLLTNPDINPAGMYEPDTFFLKHGLNIKDINEEMLKLGPKVLYDAKNGIIWITKYFFKNSKGTKIKKSVENTLSRYQKSFLVEKFLELYKHFELQVETIGYTKSIDTPCMVSNDNDNDNDNDQEKEQDQIFISEKKLTEFWNSFNIVQHKVTDQTFLKIQKKLKARLKTNSREEIAQAIKNYAEALGLGWFNYKWPLWDFLGRENANKFYPGEYIKENYMNKKDSKSQTYVEIPEREKRKNYKPCTLCGTEGILSRNVDGHPYSFRCQCDAGADKYPSLLLWEGK